MYNVVNNFLTNIAKYGRQFDVQAELVGKNKTLSVYDINVFKHRFNASLFQSVMRVIEIDSNYQIQKDTVVNPKLGIKFEPGQTILNYDYLIYNNTYKTLEDAEYDEDNRAYVALAYDKMHEAMIEYDLQLTYPITVRNLLVAICTRLGWSTSGIPASFINSTTQITLDVFSGINYTFRDVLDEIAKVTCSFPCFIADVFTLKYITETNKTINNDYLSEDNLTFTKEYFINSVVFARAENSDTYYRKDDADIEENGLHEYRLSDLQILSTDNRSAFMDEMYTYLRTLRFWIFDVQTKGVFIFDIADRFTIQTDNASYSVVLLNAEGTVEQGLSEHLYADEPEETETDYTYSTDDEKKDNLTRLLVDKTKQEIRSEISTIYATKDEVEDTVASSIGTANVLQNSDFSLVDSQGNYTMEKWTTNGRIIFCSIDK